MVMVVLINTAAVMVVSTERGSILSEVDMRQHFKQVEDLYIKPEPVSQMKTKPFREDLAEWIQEVLELHGVKVEKTNGDMLLTFPPGTTKREILPRLTGVHSWVQLPDGYKLRESIYRDMPEYSYLALLVGPQHES